ncbi:MAG TPA: MFS transporter [Janthinobacterium sp.]|jgi:MFS family permease|nr:MFS transporter [Janthinobacterium sp.]
MPHKQAQDLPDPQPKNLGWRIAATVFFTFLCYLTIGIPIAVLPSHVHLQLGFSSVWAGLAISTQYLATFATRPYAGRMADTVGSKQTVVAGLAACSLSGLLMLVSAMLEGRPEWSLGVLLLGRLALGAGESLAATGATTWAIGRVGDLQTTRVVSMNGVASYAALAAGAPLGVLVEGAGGFAAIGAVVLLIGAGGAAFAATRAPVALVSGEPMAFREVFMRVLPHGLCQALGSMGFGVISAFVTLFYAGRHWSGAALTLTAFGMCFMLARLVLGGVIGRFGGFRVAIVSFAVECAGLLLIWQAPSPHAALLGAALAGGGFSLVFPSLAREAVGGVAAANRGAALAAYSVFLDLALWAAGPLAGTVAAHYGYAAVFLFAALAAALAMLLSASLYLRTRGAGPAGAG